LAELVGAVGRWLHFAGHFGRGRCAAAFADTSLGIEGAHKFNNERERMDKLDFHLEYEWQPFTMAGRHLTFIEHQETRLLRDKCSHWGAAIYKWEGTLTQGEHAGRFGILIGETDDLRQRIKQYAKGTQPRGNAYWRKEFLLRALVTS